MKRGENVLPSEAKRRAEVVFAIRKRKKRSGFKLILLLFSCFLCLTDGKSGAENCFAQSHTLAVIELVDSNSIGLNGKCAIHLYYSGYSNCYSFLLSTYIIYFSTVVAQHCW